jgi:hypothetical protein
MMNCSSRNMNNDRCLLFYSPSLTRSREVFRYVLHKSITEINYVAFALYCSSNITFTLLSLTEMCEKTFIDLYSMVLGKVETIIMNE